MFIIIAKQVIIYYFIPYFRRNLVLNVYLILFISLHYLSKNQIGHLIIITVKIIIFLNLNFKNYLTNHFILEVKMVMKLINFAIIIIIILITQIIQIIVKVRIILVKMFILISILILFQIFVYFTKISLINLIIIIRMDLILVLIIYLFLKINLHISFFQMRIYIVMIFMMFKNL